MNRSSPMPFIPNWIVWAQCLCFSVLYAIWALPETILIRHICLIMGALLSLWVIYQYRRSFFHRHAIPTWLIVALFAWATFHLFFLSQDFTAQYEEYTSIWKRSAIGTIFALGFGIALANTRFEKNEDRRFWALFYFGILSPTIIYFIKYILVHFAMPYGFNVPEYLRLYYRSDYFYIPKTVYVCFCFPLLVVTLRLILLKIEDVKNNVLVLVFYLAIVILILSLFYIENIKNGIIYSVLFILIIGLMIANKFSKKYYLKLILVIGVITFLIIFSFRHVERNESWKYFFADIEVAMATDHFESWKFSGEKGYPNNKFGVEVHGTNYDRVSWGLEGLKLILKNPLGYGLIERSFGHLGMISWPSSKLHQSHSGWIDLTLGIGLPGLILMLLAQALILLGLHILKSKSKTRATIDAPWRILNFYMLFSLMLVWITTELSQKIFFDVLIYWTAFGAGSLLFKAKKLGFVGD